MLEWNEEQPNSSLVVEAPATADAYGLCQWRKYAVAHQATYQEPWHRQYQMQADGKHTSYLKTVLWWSSFEPYVKPIDNDKNNNNSNNNNDIDIDSDNDIDDDDNNDDINSTIQVYIYAMYDMLVHRHIASWRNSWSQPYLAVLPRLLPSDHSQIYIQINPTWIETS